MVRAETNPASMPTANRPMNAGSSVNDDASRLDGPAKVTGAAKYGRDVYIKDGMFIAFVRCPFGAADLASSDEEAAKAVPGMLDVVVFRKEGKYHGNYVGYVVAESPNAARRGLNALNCKWTKKPVKTRISDTITEMPAPEGATKEALEKAELKLEAVYTTPVQPHSCLETHGSSIDYQGDKAIVYASTQGTSAAKDGMDKFLQLPQSAIEVVCEYIGGGFGSKLGGPGKESKSAGEAAAKLKRSAWAFCDRSGEQTDTGNRPSSMTLARIGFNKDGSVVGGEIRTWGGSGIGGGGGCNVPSGRYKLVKKAGHQDVNHNGGPVMPARAPQCPQGGFAEELMVDEMAAMAGIDPLVLKTKLATRDTFREMLELGAKMIGWKDREANGKWPGVLKIGYGIGTASWHGVGPGGRAEVMINHDGSVEARTGTQDPGTGTRTAMGIAAADALGVPLSTVTVRIGHSTLPSGPGSGGSQVTGQVAPTMMSAAKNAKEQLLEVIAKEADADAADFDIKGGVITRKGQPHLQWKEACQRVPADGILGKPKGKIDPGEGDNQGVQFVKLSVDTDTGVVHPIHVVAIQSCGKVIFRKGAESQIMGSVIQGISNTLYEQQVLDRNVGTMLNDNLESYKILGPKDMPHIEPILWTHGQTGVKGVGEPPIVATWGAVACAIYNAIGKPVRDMPITPDRILKAMEGVS